MTDRTDPSKLFRGKYRSPSARMPGWNYAADGYYFITMCTKNRVPWFGEIRHGIVGLSDIGNIVAIEWQRTEQLRPNIQLDAWVVMPDHMHGIIVIDGPGATARDDTTRDHVRGVGMAHRGVGTPCHGVPTAAAFPTMTMAPITPPRPARNPHHHPEWQPGCIGSIIQQFKSVCTKQICALGYHDFEWLPRYYDRVIRDTDELRRIRRYIHDNPHKASTL